VDRTISANREDDMGISRMLYVTSREEWRSWLAKHHESEREVWLVYYKKQTGRTRIPYDDAVEEAICFGWIMDAKKPDTRAATERSGRAAGAEQGTRPEM